MQKSSNKKDGLRSKEGKPSLSLYLRQYIPKITVPNQQVLFLLQRHLFEEQQSPKAHSADL